MTTTNSMSVRRVLMPALAGCAALMLAACGSSSTTRSASGASKTTKAPYTVGIMVDTTGPAAATGVDGLKGTRFYVQKLNASGGIGGHPVKLDVCDSLSTPTGGAACATKLGGVQTHLVLSNTELGTALAALPDFQGQDIFLSPVSPLVTKAGTTTFVVNESIGSTLKPFFTSLQSQHVVRLGVLATSDATGQNLVNAIKAAAAGYNLQLTTVFASSSSTDDTPELVQLQNAKAQVIFLATLGAPINTIIQNAATLQMTEPLVIPGGAVTNQLLSALGPKLPDNLYGLGNIVVSSSQATVANHWRSFRDAYRAYAGAPMDEDVALAYYQGCVMKALLTKFGANGNASAMASYLRANPVACLGGTFAFDNPTLNVAEGLPTELLQAGATPSVGWGSIRHPL